MAVDYRRASELLSESQQAMTCDESTRLTESMGKLLNALVGTVPFDWRYNATHWAFNVANICMEIRYSIVWMRTFARYSQECSEMDRLATEGQISYYADNAATRISSCRDKIALLAWSYYCPFNPDKKDEVLNFELIRERLMTPIRFGLKLKGHEAFLDELNKLVGPLFDRAITYRHKKVHRMEPRVVLRPEQKDGQPSYMFALTTDKEVQRFDQKLSEMYPTEWKRVAIRKSCLLDGVFFDRFPPNDLLWQFDDFDEFAYGCWKRLCDAAAGSCDILLGREPMLSKDTPNGDI
jgi:hypothetical protein